MASAIKCSHRGEGGGERVRRREHAVAEEEVGRRAVVLVRHGAQVRSADHLPGITGEE